MTKPDLGHGAEHVETVIYRLREWAARWWWPALVKALSRCRDELEVVCPLERVVLTGRCEGGWFACWYTNDPDTREDHLRHGASGFPTECEAVAGFLEGERERLDRLEVVADLVRQLQALADHPEQRTQCGAVWHELLQAIASLDGAGVTEGKTVALTSPAR
jgi:hypothetical protein